MKSLAEAEDSLSEVDSMHFQRFLGKMLHHSLDDPTIQFEMAMVMPGRCKPTVGAMARLMRVIRYCIPALSWRFKLDRPQQKLAVLMDADHASDETTRKSMSCYHKNLGQCLVEIQLARQAIAALSSGESEFYAFTMGSAVA